MTYFFISAIVLSAGTKPGTCPEDSGDFGICIAKCADDSDCPGVKKCCGSCPRECKLPRRR